VEFHTIDGPGQRFVVHQAGEGPDVVLWHGFPDTPWSWAEVAEALVASGRRVTVPWLRGYHPDTVVPGRRCDALSLGRDAVGLLDAIGAPRAVIVGHDWGALLAYVAAALAPERVHALVTLGIPHPSVLRRTPAAVWAVRHFFALKLPWAARTCRRNDFAYLDRLYRRWSPNWDGASRDETLARALEALSSPAALDGAIAYYRDLSFAGLPRSVNRLPPLPGLIVGSDHSLGEQELFARTAALLPPPSRALIVPGVGHWPHRENAAVVIPELLRFLDEVGA
jgi:pimeloyl-ACP methyl ester carboxylesterase